MLQILISVGDRKGDFVVCYFKKNFFFGGKWPKQYTRVMKIKEAVTRGLAL